MHADRADGAVRPAWRRPWVAVAWGVWLLLGQVLQLQLVHAGPRVGYEHLQWTAFSPETPSPLAIAWGCHLLVVGIAAWRVRPWRFLAVPPRVVIAASLVLLASSAALSADPASYIAESVLRFVGSSAALMNALLVAASMTGGSAARLARRVGAWLGPDGSGIRPGRWVLTLAALVFVTAAVLAVVSYQRHPHVPDEVAYLLQARYLAHGMLWMPSPPVPGGFDIDMFTIEAGRWFSAFPPGWPAALAIGVLAGVPWLINPLLGAVNVVLAWFILREVHGERTARLTALLLALSPWHLFLAMSYMSHAFALTLALGSAAAMLRARRTGAVWWGWLAGIGIGFAGINRPLEGVTVAAFLGLIALGAPRGPWRIRLPAAMAGGAMLATAVGLWYNLVMTGRALEFPVEAYFSRVYGPGRYGIGFGPSRGLGWPGLDPLPGHGPFDVVINTLLNLFQVNTELLGWAGGSLALVAVGLAWPRRSGGDTAMLMAILLVPAVQSLFWFSGGPDFGARYWFLLVVPLCAFAARGVLGLAGAVEERQGRVFAAVIALSLGALLVFIPWRAVDKYRHYRGMRPEGPRVALRAAGDRAVLVLVAGERFPDFASAAVYNPVDVTAPGRTVFAWDRDPTIRAGLLAAYPDRPVWHLRGPSVTGGSWDLDTLTGRHPRATTGGSTP